MRLHLDHLIQQSSANLISVEHWGISLKRAKLYNLIGQRDKELEDLGALGILAEALR